MRPNPITRRPVVVPDVAQVAQNIQAIVQQEVATIAAIVAKLPRSANSIEADRIARTLATLTRTLQEALRLNARRHHRKNRRMTTEVPTIPTSSSESWHDGWTHLQELGLGADYLLQESPAFVEKFSKLWRAFAHEHQREPLLAQGGAPWTTWLILGGRGAGKTRAGAEWVRAQARDPSARIALIGETERDVREVMIEGVSGLLALCEGRRAAGVDFVAPPPRMAERRGRAKLSRPTIRTICAGRNSPRPGATSSPSGAMPKRHSTCCSSGCALASGRGR